MKEVISKSLIIFLLLLLPAAIVAQLEVVGEEPDIPASEIGQDPLTTDEIPFYNITQNEFDDIWAQYKTYMVEENYDEAANEILRLVALKDERQIKRLTFYAEALSADAYIFLGKTGKREIAHRLFKIAQLVDPQLPDAYLLPFFAELKTGFGGLQAVPDLIKGTLAYFQDPYNGLSGMSSLLTVFLKSLMIAGIIFSLILFVKFSKLFMYDIKLASVFGIEDSMRKFSSWFFLLLPFVFWLGFEYIILYLLVIFLPYAKSSVKIIGILILLCAFIYIPWLKFNNALIHTVNNEDAKFAVLAGSVYYSDNMSTLVTEHRKKSTSSQELDLIQTKILIAYGRYAEAYNAYRIMMRKYPSRADILINMGNIRFFLGRYDLAKVHYEEALARESNNIIALYNYKLTVEQIDPFRDTADLKNRIQQLDPEFANHVFVTRKEKNELIWVDSDTNKDKQEKLSGFINSSLKEQNKGADSILSLFLNPLSLSSIVAIVAFLLINSAWIKRGLSEYCQKCGRIYRPTKGTAAVEGKYCKQCISIFFQKDGVAPNVQRKKIVAIGRQRKREKILKGFMSTFIPGARNIYSERGITGFLVLWKWVFLIIVIIEGTSLIIFPFTAVRHSFGPYKIIAAALFIQTQLTSMVVGFVKGSKGE